MRLTSPSRDVRTALRLQAAGILDEPLPSLVTTVGAAATSQTVFGLLCGLASGDVVAGVVIKNLVAAAGTAPTLARVGLADKSGVMLAVSSDVGAAANWALGPNKLAFTAPYTIAAGGGYIVCFVVNGVWGSTQPSIANQVNAVSFASTAIAGAAPFSFNWTGQTDLPAVGAALTISTAGGLRYIAPYGTPIS